MKRLPGSAPVNLDSETPSTEAISEAEARFERWRKVCGAVAAPVGSPPLAELARGDELAL